MIGAHPLAIPTIISAFLALAPATEPRFEAGLDVVAYSRACQGLQVEWEEAKVKESASDEKTVDAANKAAIEKTYRECVEPALNQCKLASHEDIGKATQELVRMKARLINEPIGQVCTGEKATQYGAPMPVPGSAWQDAVIRGIAGFVVKRARAEALAFILQTLFAELCEAKSKGAEVLPATCAVLRVNSTQSDVSVWGTVKGALELDFPELPVRLLEQLARDNKDFPNLAEAAVLVAEVATMVRALRRGEGVRDAFVALKRLGAKPPPGPLGAEAAREFFVCDRPRRQPGGSRARERRCRRSGRVRRYGHPEIPGVHGGREAVDPQMPGRGGDATGGRRVQGGARGRVPAGARCAGSDGKGPRGARESGE